MSTTRSIRQVRADLVLEAITATRVARFEDIPDIPRFAGWAPNVLEVAIADLVADGRIVEGPTGKLIVTGSMDPTGTRS